jgi:hypothetical protein
MNKKTQIWFFVFIVVIIIALITFSLRSYPKTQPLTIQQPANTMLYASSTMGFSIYYPIGFTVDQNYSYQELGPGKDISGVKFTIPASLATGTNLGSDSYLSIEKIPQTGNCTANLFLGQQGSSPMISQTLTDNGTTYSVASTTGAGAGNRYFETVYALTGTNPCVAVRYFIHYGVFENYPAGSITEFDQVTLLSKFDAIRRTLTISK